MGYQPVQISQSEYSQFCQEYYASPSRRFLRLGQAFCNRFRITNPELFYETDQKKAQQYIYNHYVLGLSNPPKSELCCLYCGASNELEYELYCTGECLDSAA